MCYATPTCMTSYWCDICAYEHPVQPAWVLYTNIDMYMSWFFSYDLCVGTTKLGRPCQLDPPTWGSPSCSCQLQYRSCPTLLPGSVAVVLSSYIYVYVYISFAHHFVCTRPMLWICFHHISDGGFSFCVVTILPVSCLLVPYMLYIAHVF